MLSSPATFAVVQRHRRTVVVVGAILLLLFLRQHIYTGTQLISVYLLWHPSSRHVALSSWRDGLDTTFAAYPVNQTTASLPAVPGEDIVPPILHHILLGRPISSSPATWNSSRDACLALHPTEQGWQHFWWDDVTAEAFLSENYPWALRFFLRYPHVIQRADALRYFIMHHYGGFFLDLDLECLRSLGPLRRFPTVTIAASPAGVSNGFLVAEPRHPFFAQLIENLRLYDLNWFFSSYVSIMFSTGPMFLSAEHLRYSPRLHRRDDLRVLTAPMHMLNGKVKTPLFRHLGSSSWHGGDVTMIRSVLGWLRSPGHIFFVLLGVALGALMGVWLTPLLAKRWPRIRRHLASAASARSSPYPKPPRYTDDVDEPLDLEAAALPRPRSSSLNGSIVGDSRAAGGPGLYVLVELSEGEDGALERSSRPSTPLRTPRPAR